MYIILIKKNSIIETNNYNLDFFFWANFLFTRNISLPLKFINDLRRYYPLPIPTKLTFNENTYLVPFASVVWSTFTVFWNSLWIFPFKISPVTILRDPIVIYLFTISTSNKIFILLLFSNYTYFTFLQPPRPPHSINSIPSAIVSLCKLFQNTVSRNLKI